MKQKPSAPNRIRELRKAAGLTLAQLADRMDPAADIGGLQKIETGQRNLTLDWIKRISAALGVAPSALVDEGAAVAWVPVIGEVAAGSWREAVEQATGDSIPVPKAPRDAFALRARGDSMNMLVADGGYVVVDPHDRELLSGRVYVFQNSDGVTLKRYQPEPARLVPMSTSPANREILLGTEPVTTIGRVVWTSGPA